MNNNEQEIKTNFYKLSKAVLGFLHVKVNDANLLDCHFDIDNRKIGFTLSEEDYEFLISCGFLTMDGLNMASTQIIGGAIPNYLE